MRHAEFTWRAPDGTTLFAQAWEPVERPGAVLGIVHGLGEHSGRYGAVVERFVQAGISVVAYDQRGHGRTGGILPAFATLLDDIDLLTTEMLQRGTGRQFLWGHSLGGGLALYYCLFRHSPLSGVIASSPLLKPTVRPPAWKYTLAHVLARVWPACKLHAGIDPCGLSHDPGVVRRYREDKKTLAHARRLSIPVLLLHGTADPVTSFASSRAFAERAGALCTFLAWEGLFHELHFETQGDQVVQRMCDWMRGV